MSEDKRSPKTATCEDGLSGEEVHINNYAKGTYTEEGLCETPGFVDKRRKRNTKTKGRFRAKVNYSVCEAKASGPDATTLASADISIGGFLDMIDTFDREPATSAELLLYNEAKAYATIGFTRKPGERLPKAGAYAAAGFFHAKAQCSVFEAEAKGPNASAKASASVEGLEAMLGAEIASASASAGPVKLKVGLGVDTGVQIGLGGAGAKLLGTGLKIGPQPSVALLGSEVECSVM